MKIWEPQLPGTLWATPGLYGTPLPFPIVQYYTGLVLVSQVAQDIHLSNSHEYTRILSSTLSEITRTLHGNGSLHDVLKPVLPYTNYNKHQISFNI
jgi:hypothetical protein